MSLIEGLIFVAVVLSLPMVVAFIWSVKRYNSWEQLLKCELDWRFGKLFQTMWRLPIGQYRGVVVNTHYMVGEMRTTRKEGFLWSRAWLAITEAKVRAMWRDALTPCDETGIIYYVKDEKEHSDACTKTITHS